jgi:transcriptional regulator with XRE-family HTH domain
MVSESEIGKRIKQYRIEKGMNLPHLAEMTKLTKGYLSKIENSPKAPPISTLIAIGKALNVSVSDILGETEETRTIALVRKGERPVVVKSGSSFGYAYQALAHTFHHKHMEPWILTAPLNSTHKPLFEHQGEEMIFVLEGRVKFLHGDKKFILEEGDCIYFNAGIPHTGIAQGKKAAKMLIVIYSPKR